MSATVIRMTSTGQTPEPNLAGKLIVLCAFDKDEDGVLHAAFEPREIPDERRAVATARDMAKRHIGVIAWSREANIAVGEYGPPEVLYQTGEVPEML